MAAITADILKSHFGFNNPDVIQGILSDPGQVARYEKEYGGGDTAGASSLPSTQDFIKQQQDAQDALMAKYSTAVSGQEALPAAYERLNTAAGIPGLQTDIQTYKNQIYKVQGLIDTLEENVNERTKGSLTTEAQRQRQIAYEQAPLGSELGRLATGLQPLTEQLSTASGNVATQLSLEQAQQAKDLLPIQAQISAFSDQAAREVSLYTTGKQQELDALTAKAKSQADLSKADYDRATDLLKIEAEYNSQKKLVADNLSASITLKNSSSLGTDTSKYLSPSMSSPAGTMSADGNWYSTGGGWVRTVQ